MQLALRPPPPPSGMRWRIRYQLLTPLVILLLGVVALSSWTALGSAQRAWQQTEAQVRSVARTLSEASFPLHAPILEQMKGLSGADYLLVGADGRHTATFTPSDIEPPASAADDWHELHLGPRVVVAGTTYLCSGLRLHRPPEVAGATLYILYPESRWRDALWEAVWPSLVIGGFAGLASLLLAIILGQGIGRRVYLLEQRTRLIAAGDFSPMPLPWPADELRDLAESVNNMARQLAQLQESARKTERLRLLGQVSSGLAHQLRNGLTGARLAVQVHARECDGRTDPESLRVALRQLTLLEAHLKRFLDLGRTEPMRRESCELALLIDDAVALLQPQCRHTGTELHWRPPAEPFKVQADPGQLGQLLLNVLGNAVEAAAPGGRVSVELRQPAGASVIVEVSDSGPGPPANLANHLFDAFVTGKPEGVGLGLAVARQVAEAHGGRITWERLAGQTVFQIELPLEHAP